MKHIFVNGKPVAEATKADLFAIVPAKVSDDETEAFVKFLTANDPSFDVAGACGVYAGLVGTGKGKLELRGRA